jgi:hypothetical protein
MPLFALAIEALFAATPSTTLATELASAVMADAM